MLAPLLSAWVSLSYGFSGQCRCATHIKKQDFNECREQKNDSKRDQCKHGKRHGEHKKHEEFTLHVHAVEGVTTNNDRHCHRILGVSGAEIELSDDHHFHIVKGRTTWEDGHWHFFCVRSGLDVELPKDFHTHEVKFWTFMAQAFNPAVS